MFFAKYKPKTWVIRKKWKRRGKDRIIFCEKLDVNFC